MTKTQKINKDQLLSQLELVQPGLSNREIIEQSSCYIFRDGLLCTYNDEIACTLKSCLDITGAVRATPLLSLLRQLKEEVIEISTTETALVVRGKSKRADIVMEADITIPIESVERPTKWSPVSEQFSEAVKLVEQCVSKNEEHFSLTCIHIHPHWVEACDNHQATRVDLDTGIKKSILAKRDSLKWVSELDMQKFCETENWLHFKNSSGLILSCRRYEDEFPELDAVLDNTGEKMSLPKGLVEAAKKASIFSSDTQDSNQILVKLEPSKLRLEGSGVTGSYKEVKKVSYKGPKISFLVGPDLLQEITKQHNQCEVSKNHLIVRGPNFRFVSCVGAA